jgi:ribosome-associated protein
MSGAKRSGLNSCVFFAATEPANGAICTNYNATVQFVIPEAELDITAVRSAGAGGQNVNKVSSAIHLRFDVAASSLPAWLKARLLERKDSRITRDGVVVIKAQQHRSQEQNRYDAIERLHALVRSAAHRPKTRRPTRTPRASKQRRLESKKRRGAIKALRGRIDE